MMFVSFIQFDDVCYVCVCNDAYVSLNPDNFKKASEQAIKAEKNLWNPFLSWLGV